MKTPLEEFLVANFKCQRCNACCRQKGFVYLTRPDINRIIAYLKITESDFKNKYCEKDESRWVLRSLPDDACIFLNETGCSIHAAKPTQCADFPYKWRDDNSFDYCEGLKSLPLE